MRLRSLMSRMNACQPPVGDDVRADLHGHKRSVPSSQRPLGLVNFGRLHELGLDRYQPSRIFGRNHVEDRLPDQIVPLVAEEPASGLIHVREACVEVGEKVRFRRELEGLARALGGMAQVAVRLLQAAPVPLEEPGHVEDDEPVDAEQHRLKHRLRHRIPGPRDEQVAGEWHAEREGQERSTKAREQAGHQHCAEEEDERRPGAGPGRGDHPQSERQRHRDDAHGIASDHGL